MNRQVGEDRHDDAELEPAEEERSWTQDAVDRTTGGGRESALIDEGYSSTCHGRLWRADEDFSGDRSGGAEAPEQAEEEEEEIYGADQKGDQPQRLLGSDPPGAATMPRPPPGGDGVAT